MRAVVPARCAIGIAAAAGWMLAGGSLPSSELIPFGHSEPTAIASGGGAPVHIDTSPEGAQVHVDGGDLGKTPLDARLEPGQHWLSLRHPETLDEDHVLGVPDTGATVDVGLWRRRPDVVALRPVYPGAWLEDARFLDDGQVALLVDLPSPPGTPSPSYQLWRMDPASGQLTRVALPGVDSAASAIALSPSGDLVAYVIPGSSPTVTATGWSAGGGTANATPQASQPEWVWVGPPEGDQLARRIFELPSDTHAGSSVAEHIVELVWTPDEARLVAITRQTGPPGRARIFLLNVAASGDADQESTASELVVLPTEVLPDPAVPDPSGRWLALITHTSVVSSGNNLLNLCLLQLQPGGTFRDVADLGVLATAPAAPPLTWPPATEKDAPARLLFVGPAPASASGGGGLFGIFGLFRPSAPPSGLFLTDLGASALADAQPRRVGSAINTAAWWCRLAIDANNAACGVFGAPSIAEVVSTMLRVILDPTHISGLLMLLVAVVMAILLLVQQLMRLALVDVLLILAPLAGLLWILPQSQAWGRLWGRLFIGTVFAQAVQVLALRLGFNLATGLPPLSASGLLQPLLGIATLALVLKIPGLMRGGGAGGNIVANLAGTAAGAVVGSGVGVAVRGALGAGTRAGRRDS